MRALTIQQPWAWAIVHGGKIIENRTRNIAGSYCGPVAIHAGLKLDEDALHAPIITKARLRVVPGNPADRSHDYVFGAVIGVVDLTGVHRSSECDTGDGGRCSTWAETGDVWHLRIANPRSLTEPIQCRGALGLWTPQKAVLDQLNAEIAKQGEPA